MFYKKKYNIQIVSSKKLYIHINKCMSNIVMSINFIKKSQLHSIIV